jgi:hypothetical protein
MWFVRRGEIITGMFLILVLPCLGSTNNQAQSIANLSSTSANNQCNDQLFVALCSFAGVVGCCDKNV